MSNSICGRVSQAIEAAGLWGAPGNAEGVRRTHLVSPEPFLLSPRQVDILHRLGPALLAFYRAANDLYLRSGYEWVNEYLNIGKDEDILRHSVMKYQKRMLPGILRPDILITDDGFSITELDSVPGGFGHLDCLSAAYEEAGLNVMSSPRGIRDGFANMLRCAAGKDDPVCAIVVSDESSDYLPEMRYIASELQKIGLSAFCVRPKEVVFTEDGLYIEPEGQKLRVDVVYRFFELFDLHNIPKSDLIAYAAKGKLVVVTPPYKHFLEEKMLLALARHEALEDYWRRSIGDDAYSLLMSVFVPTYILDNRPVPPHARISGFKWRGEAIRDWIEITQGTQKERRLIIKPSGYSPLAWGARGVVVGHDLAQEEWARAVERALADFSHSPHVLQPFSETALIGVKYCSEAGGEMREMQARVRLCPYYFVTGEEAKLGGVLATACPRNKKLIHGMVDAVMSPCCE